MNIPKSFIDDTISLRHLLHQNAELSLHEEKTRKILIEKLSTLENIEVKDMGKWILAIYKPENPKGKPIAFRADFDALPIVETIDKPYASLNKEVSHRCGHDGHASCLYGFASMVNAYGADREIIFCFQHAEEIGAGGEECAEYLAKLEPEYVYAFHNWSGFPEGAVIVKDGPVHCASKGITFNFIGKNSHASQPEDGINPAEAISDLVKQVSFTNDQEHKGLLLATIVDISLGDKNFGISPGEGSLSVTLRGEYFEEYDEAEKSLRAAALSIAKQYNLTLEVTECDVFPETANTADAAEYIRKAAKEANINCYELNKPFRSSEDFGYFTRKIHGAIFYIGNGEDYPAIHTIGYDFNDNIIPTALKMFCELGGVRN